MRTRFVAILVAAGLLLGAAGCKRRAAPAPVQTASSGGLPAGWKTYTPPEGDFTVAVPGDPALVQPQREADQNLRLFVFRKGEAALHVMVFERTGKATQRDTPAEIRSDPQVIAGTVRDVQMGVMSGLEFQYNDPQDGVCLMRVCRSADGTRAVTLRIVKPGLLASDETRAFLESFKLSGR
jgi:hypothetical protein